MNKTLELQKLSIKAINNIEYFKNNNISAYTTIPLKVKMPYIKLYSLKTNIIENINELQRIAIDFFVAANGKTNKQLLEIMEILYNEFPDKINEEISNCNSELSIYNIFDATFTITEDIKNNIWFGHYVISIDI